MNPIRVLLFTVPVMAMAADFHALTERYFNECYLPLNPSTATASGFHQWDGELEDYTKAGVDRAIRMSRTFEREFAAIDAAKLNAADRADREIVLAHIRADLFELETIRGWERNPDRYSSGISNSVFVLMSRRFAAPAERLRSVIERERRMPAVFDAARANLKNPPRIFTSVAIEQLPGIVSFFEKDVPAAFVEVSDAKLLTEFNAANSAVIKALKAYGKFLQDDLLPRSNGDFRIGAANYRKKLALEEMVTTPLDELLKLGYDDLRRNQAQLAATARKLDPNFDARKALEEIGKDHPEPSQLLAAFRDVLGGVRDFIQTRKLLTIPSPVPPILEETPPFMRALTFASMDTPGPYEDKATEAFFNVTLPEKNWSVAEVSEHMAAFNRPVILSTAIHEAYPGHYVQFLWVKRAPSKVRKLLGCSSNAEGWAHYTEQMMLDEGFGNGDPKLRLGQLQDALLRNARYIVGIEMHTGTMTFDQAVDFFVNEGFQTRTNALREVKRGTSDPTYLVYTLGKLEVLRMREDYKRKQGAAFRLADFHDRFLAEGFPPLKIVRAALGL